MLPFKSRCRAISGPAAAVLILAAASSFAFAESFPAYHEAFKTASPSFPGTEYPNWAFVGKEGASASVGDDGRLRIMAGTEETYSYGRATITSGETIGLPEFPDNYSVFVSLGGGTGSPGSWNVAIEVNRVWIGFYPGYQTEVGKGHFYACFAEGYGELISHIDMGFVPQPDILYPMEIKVTRVGTGGQRFKFDVVVKNPEMEGEKFCKSFEADLPDNLLPIDSVSLWRVDGPGGDGIFSDLKLAP